MKVKVMPSGLKIVEVHLGPEVDSEVEGGQGIGETEEGSEVAVVSEVEERAVEDLAVVEDGVVLVTEEDVEDLVIGAVVGDLEIEVDVEDLEAGKVGTMTVREAEAVVEGEGEDSGDEVLEVETAEAGVVSKSGIHLVPLVETRKSLLMIGKFEF